MPHDFDTFFRAATATEANPHGNMPYDYQRRLACGERNGRSDAEWLVDSTACDSRLIDIPTGLGKTAAVVLAWLSNRVALQRADWPRRLVYCLPMRTLVEQTEGEVRKWLGNLLTKSSELGFSAEALADLTWLQDHSPVVLMGGEELDAARRDWDIHPERPAILIGTQDMLLSRALNRGYGMSRYRWPMHFGLLNNDALWVMDETQLMGVGVETSAQLDGLRHQAATATVGSCPTWWMSATLDDARLATVDHPKPTDGWPTEKLSPFEEATGRAHALITARKVLSAAQITLSSASEEAYPAALARLIHERHQPGTLTLVVLNRVSRAREVHAALTGGKSPLYARDRVALIHSRFRPVDRARHTRLLFDEGDRIVIATQAVEAGVDVSARLLITELAPWSSLVQRIGRCNRRADIPDAAVLWVDIQPRSDKDDLTLPYSPAELTKAREALAPLADAGPLALRGVVVAEEPVIRPVLRRRDLVDLFDTTPDICGQDLDISRYIRDGEDSDVQFFWRSIEADAPTDQEPPAHRDELCRVPIGEAVRFLKKATTHAWRWNPLGKDWESAARPRPGAIYLLTAASGGYSDTTGWTGDPKHKPAPHPRAGGTEEAHDDDRQSISLSWQPLSEHTRQVVQATETLSAALGCDSSIASTLHQAALWHDVGKAHGEFQAMLRHGDPGREGTLWAKSANIAGHCARRGFRHELASALAWLLAGPADASERDLVAYLIAAHHGKVRLSIRSLPGETGNPADPDALFARGVWHGERLPSVALDEITTPEIALDLSFMRMGEGPHGPSWLARTVALRDRFGPFRLAFLETILRAADALGSKSQAAVSQNGVPDAPHTMELHEPCLPYAPTQREIELGNTFGETFHEPSQPGVPTALSPDEQALVAGLVADGLSIQEKFRPDPLYKQTGKGHFEGGTVEEIRRARETGKHGGDAP